jgi:hypothetical protein
MFVTFYFTCFRLILFGVRTFFVKEAVYPSCENRPFSHTILSDVRVAGVGFLFQLYLARSKACMVRNL